MSARDRFVLVNNLRLHYREWEQPLAPAVILLHGGSAHAHWWDMFADEIGGDYSVFALDLRGHGDSEHAQPPAYRLEDYRQDVAAFIDAKGLDRVTLIGHSLGGMVAAAVAASAPARVRSLIVVDSALKVTPAGARYMARLHKFPHPVYATREQALRRFRLLPTHTTAAPSVLERVAAQGVRQLPNGRWTLKFDREALACHEPQDLTPQLAELHCPILFIRGAHSTLLTEAGVGALLAAAPHARAVEIAAAHHHVMLDNPPEFAGVVRAFLAEASERTVKALESAGPLLNR